MSNFLCELSSSEVSAYYAARVPGLRQRGQHWRGKCPIHRGKRDSFSVDPATGLWRCWSECGCGGNIVALEMALRGLKWNDAVIEIEGAIGRPLLHRPTSHRERRALSARLARDRHDAKEAAFWRMASEQMAEEALENLPEAASERYGPTQFLLSIRQAQNDELLALYRDYRNLQPRFAAALVHAGEQAWRRLSIRLARFIRTGMENSRVA